MADKTPLERRMERWVAFKEADWTPYATNTEARKTMKHNDPVLDSFAEAVEDRYGLPPGVLVAIKNAGEMTPLDEGGWRSSPKGASGVMQFMPKMVEAFPHDPSDPFESIDAAGKLLSEQLKNSGGDVMAAVAMYNGGTAAMKAVRAGGEPPAEETRNYLTFVSEYMQKIYLPRVGERIKQRATVTKHPQAEVSTDG